MKNWLVLIALLLVTILLLGCTQAPQGDALLTLDVNSDLNSNINDSNSNVFNNLDEFKKVKAGDNVSVDYTGRHTDGTIFDTSIGRTPLKFEVGAGQMIKGFDDGVLGMKVGEKKTITILPPQAYGNYNLDLVKTFDKNSPDLSQLGTLFVGMELNSSYGVVKVIEVNDNNVVIDFNHKLAGKTLIFEITLISIN